MSAKIDLEQLEKISHLLENFISQISPNRKDGVAAQIAYCNMKIKEFAQRSSQGVNAIVSSENFPNVRENCFEDGMNSHGILLDRLTILLCKKHLAANNHFSMIDTNNQIRGILRSISSARLARTPMLAKEATERIKNPPESLGNPLISLQSSNLLMWINQDLLYTSDVESAPQIRLREYIKFFGTSNRERNSAIEAIDLWFLDRFRGVE